ncbi:MAG: Flp pilus assembly complex ATPase component TadA [Acidobacteria bacterium]|nr:Flp pilus assembly complex ATPase component TadA [Acidobacteriota bacterium]MBI3663195.1 Flp pilus assembly complex ATPase component TadA [Acidobacteriota bacterium]
MTESPALAFGPQFRLGQLALTLRSFSVSELQTLTGYTPSSIHGFIHQLKKVNPEFIDFKEVPRAGPGRPPKRYWLTPVGVEYLMEKSNDLAALVDQEIARSREPAVRPTQAPQKDEARAVAASLFPRGPEGSEDLDRMLEWAGQVDATNLYLAADRHPCVKVGERRHFLVEKPILTREDIQAIASGILTPWQKERLSDSGSVVCTYHPPNPSRFARYFVTASYEQSGIGLALHTLRPTIPRLEELDLPWAANSLPDLESGLVFVTGSEGSDQTDTLAALLDRINETRDARVVTLEDPIVYCHRNKKSIISQREVYVDCPDVATGLQAAVRDDADILVLSVPWDRPGLEAALEAASSRLVFCRGFARDSWRTIRWLLDQFPEAEQPSIRSSVAAHLRSIVALRSMPRADHTGRIRATEILLENPAIRDLILHSDDLAVIPNWMETRGSESGMWTLDQAIAHFYHSGLITFVVAMANVSLAEKLGAFQAEIAPPALEAEPEELRGPATAFSE